MLYICQWQDRYLLKGTYIYTIQIINVHTFQNRTHIDLNKKRGRAISAKNYTAIVSRFMIILKTDLNQT